MNYLSHFYFDRYTTDPNRVIGTVLPDLLKNVRKDWNLRPEKISHQFHEPSHQSILEGWRRHLAVDKHFHNAPFFIKHTSAIRQLIVPILKTSQARPSFVAHIALELMLDSLLLTENILRAETLYEKLAACNREQLQSFLEINGIREAEQFFAFLDNFIELGYLDSYREAQQIIYALSRICMRVWPTPMAESEMLQLHLAIAEYQDVLKEDYESIFNEIDQVLDPGPTFGTQN